jgi:hypothetical protein
MIPFDLKTISTVQYYVLMGVGTLLTWAITVGWIPALIAKQKGRSFWRWWIYGTLAFVIALVHALVIKSNKSAREQRV